MYSINKSNLSGCNVNSKDIANNIIKIIKAKGNPILYIKLFIIH